MVQRYLLPFNSAVFCEVSPFVWALFRVTLGFGGLGVKIELARVLSGCSCKLCL